MISDFNSQISPSVTALTLLNMFMQVSPVQHQEELAIPFLGHSRVCSVTCNLETGLLQLSPGRSAPVCHLIPATDQHCSCMEVVNLLMLSPLQCSGHCLLEAAYLIDACLESQKNGPVAPSSLKTLLCPAPCWCNELFSHTLSSKVKDLTSSSSTSIGTLLIYYIL